ncbi:terminal uridylyltransferase Tailor [Drosophila pseudoobscura]|uniref:Terminal uridylyltransferase Tailor n=1 Tax=Drosophila pseudoobscura pseudoobscura TaxID=46245 RepID=A0A6I8VKY6_DROPS|nr:terminal uridylyltransferase Tailor [Drosophila pseudoobscura]XP_015043482.2 terminal uridylyltransferase Tailor [Drosophila pseudoobscura]
MLAPDRVPAETRAPGDSAADMVFCTVCAAPFQNVTDCLAHELQKHKNTKNTQKKFRQKLSALTKQLASDQTQSERSKLQEALDKTSDGQYLETILNLYKADSIRLNRTFSHVRNCFEREEALQVKVFPFGSLVTGLALDDSDIDLYLESTNDQLSCPKRLFNKVLRLLHRSICFTDVTNIRHARVPIIRCKHQLTGLHIDINMSNPNSTYNSRFIRDLMSREDKLHKLALFLKIWGKKLKVVRMGGMNSYCLLSLLLVNLQVRNLLPSIKELQTRTEPINVNGVNYAYSLELVPPLPAQMSTLELIGDFFAFCTSIDFETTLLSPFLGCAVDKVATLATPGGYPQYEEQLAAIQDAVGEAPEKFHMDRTVCVQDPFELQRNVARNISQTDFLYIRQCMVMAAQAFKNPELLADPKKLYDYLLFGLAEKMVAEKSLHRPTPAKKSKGNAIPTEQQIEKVLVPTEQHPEMTETENVEDQSRVSWDVPTCLPETKRTHLIFPSKNDLKSLHSVVLSEYIEHNRTIYYYWLLCYVDTIKNVLTEIFSLDLELEESNEPCYYKWLIRGTVDTWTGRVGKLLPGQPGQYFDIHKQQTVEMLKTRSGNPQQSVSLMGYFAMRATEDYKKLELCVEACPGHYNEMQRLGSITKLFKALKDLLSKYTFQEKLLKWDINSGRSVAT